METTEKPKTPKQERQRLYYLHEQLKKRYEIDIKEKRLYVPNFDAIPEPFGGYVRELQARGYAVELAVFPPEKTASIGEQRIKRIARIFAGSILATLDNFGNFKKGLPEHISPEDFEEIKKHVGEMGLAIFDPTGKTITVEPETRAAFMQGAINEVLKIK